MTSFLRPLSTTSFAKSVCSFPPRPLREWERRPQRPTLIGLLSLSLTFCFALPADVNDDKSGQKKMRGKSALPLVKKPLNFWMLVFKGLLHESCRSRLQENTIKLQKSYIPLCKNRKKVQNRLHKFSLFLHNDGRFSWKQFHHLSIWCKFFLAISNSC